MMVFSSTQPALRFLALGDSYTIGEGVAEEERFPALTAALLQKINIPVSKPFYIAKTGWTTANLLDVISYEADLGHFDIVTLLIGVNDQYQGLDPAGYRARFTQLLEKAVRYADNRKSRVFVLSIPDYSATPFVKDVDKMRVQKEIEMFNAINKEITIKENIAYIDITPLSQQAGLDPTLLAKDLLHYSGKEHEKWAALLSPVIQKSL